MIRRPPRSTLFSLHDALPIYDERRHDRHRARRSAEPEPVRVDVRHGGAEARDRRQDEGDARQVDRKSTRLNSSHSQISYAVFCLKKKKKKKKKKKQHNRTRKK